MPNKPTHVAWGMGTGGGFAAYQAWGQPPLQFAYEVAGGIVGGYFGGRAPDVIDPPISPRHRAIGHGILPVGAIGTAYASQLNNWQDSLRNHAANYRVKREATDSFWASLWNGFMEMLCHLGAGFLAGFGAGYASHIALDAGTPAGLPWVA